MTITPVAMGQPLDRLDGPDKVQGLARYAFEHQVDRPAYLYPVQATIANGRIRSIVAAPASAEPGVLTVLTHDNAPRLAVQGGETGVLQCDRIAFRGQLVGAVVAETSEVARYAAGLVRLTYDELPHDVELTADRAGLRTPAQVIPLFPMDTEQGDVEGTLAAAAVMVDRTYRTAMYHHNPMEPHTTVATWTDDGLTLYVSTQSVYAVKRTAMQLFDLPPDRVRVISRYVGGAFGAKVYQRAEIVLAIMAARAVPGRPVRFALTRQQMFSQVGYRTPTIQRVQLGADAGGRLVTLAHGSIEQTSTIEEFAEHATRMTPVMYAAPNRRTTQRVAALDVPTPTIMRAPGECSGMFALESAMDELAIACNLDPVELRIRNDPPTHPVTGQPFSSRNLVACLREGARRFGWPGRDATPRARRRAGWLLGTGMAASTYPTFRLPGSVARISAGPDGRYAVQVAAADLGTGTWTALTQIAADALEVSCADIELGIGDTAYPMASEAGASTGIMCWGTAIVEAARKLRKTLDGQHGGTVPPEGLTVEAAMPDNEYAKQYAMHTFGAQFVEVRVNEETGEVRVPRMVGVFAVGRVMNSKTGLSQLLGGMTMGLSMALFENSVVDARFGHVVNHDFAQYHIASNADVGSVDVHWIDEHDPYVTPMGAKGMGEIGIVGTAAAIANAVYHATGVRVRELPITLDKLLSPE